MNRKPFSLTSSEWLYFIIPVLASLWVSFLYLLPAKGVVWFDDPYIFFQYARNLAHGQGISFNPGEVSFGVTSILWPLLVGVLIRVTGWDVIVVSQWLSILFYACSAGVLTLVTARLLKRPWLALVAGCLYVTYPSLVKIGLSGMEVGLLLFLLSGILLLLLAARPLAWALGLLSGLAYLTRPDGLLLFPLLLLWLVMIVWRSGRSVSRLAGQVVQYGLTFVIVIAPWFFYLFERTGRFLPTTQIGKLQLWLPYLFDVGYDQYASLGIGGRFLIAVRAFQFFLDSRHIILLLSLAMVVFVFWKGASFRLRAAALIGFLYSAGLPWLYGLTFPIFTIRYFTGMMFFAMFALGLILDGLYEQTQGRMGRAMASRGAVLAAIVLAAVVAGMHFLTFSNYLTQVEQQRVRVESGRWLHLNTDPKASFATEPIGALGFYSQRYVVDMGGLINEQTQTLMPEGCTSSQGLLQFLDATQPDYIVDASGLCLVKPVLDQAGRKYEVLYTADSANPEVVDSAILKIVQ